ALKMSPDSTALRKVSPLPPLPRQVSLKVVDEASLPEPVSSSLLQSSHHVGAGLHDHPDQYEKGLVSGRRRVNGGSCARSSQLKPVQDLSRTPTLVEEGKEKEITYAEMKIPIRRTHFMADVGVLMRQFTNTMLMFQDFLFQQATDFRKDCTFRPSIRQYQGDYRVVHLHTHPNVSIHDMYTASIQQPVLYKWKVPVIFPIREGVWELVVQKENVEILRKASPFDDSFSFWIEEADSLPKGIAARAAQVYSRVPLIKRSVARIYAAMLQNYARRHVMKDVVESLAIRRPVGAIVDGWICLFESYPEI
ncbi:MAG: hypothetical protein Q9184_007193, partial [Pyrenodesmia sp. 2 TL-2023]